MTSNGPDGGASAMTSPAPSPAPSTTNTTTTAVRSLARDDGPYVLRPWVDPVPLSADGTQDGIRINCVEYYDGNLYVGTSASELLHFVRLPPDPADKSGRPVFIPASRLTPVFNENATSRPGVQQILLLPRVGKACILCNRTVTFYSLPELTPSGTREVNNCNWIGGVDLNEQDSDDEAPGLGGSVIILLSTNKRIQVVKIEDGVRAIKACASENMNIDFAGSNLSVRRDSIACVADSKTYALIDVDHQLKIPLMSISSLDDGPPPGVMNRAQSIPGIAEHGVTRSASSGESRPHPSPDSHKRSRSTGVPEPGATSSQESQIGSSDAARLTSPSPPSQPSTPQPPGEGVMTPPLTDKPLPTVPGPSQRSVYLKPHITSPTSEEFLLVIGTSPTEPGVGMFINLDGDPTRPTITFSTYPREIVVDGRSAPNSVSSPTTTPQEEEEGYVLASMAKDIDGSELYGLEIQRWDAGSEAHPELHWLQAENVTDAYGIRSLTSSQEAFFDEIVEQLSMRKFIPFPSSPVEPEDPGSALKTSESRTSLTIERLNREKSLFERELESHEGEPLPEGWEAARSLEGEEFARRLAKTQTRLAVWSGNRIWWAIRNPLIVQLDAKLEVACARAGEIDKVAIHAVLSAIQGREPRTELEFTTMSYIQQKAGILLLVDLLLSPAGGDLSDSELAKIEEVLVDSKLDPRVVLSLIPGIRNEIIEGRQGIWVYSGVKKAPETLLQSNAFLSRAIEGIRGLQPKLLQLLKRYLQAWRKLKGFGSVSVEAEVFRTVDAALLLVLLEIDRESPKGRGRPGTPRAELNDLVDGGMESFERAITLLQAYHRLFVLSRLYQSRKMSAEVLATWRRIIEGEEDDGQELQDGEQRVRDYLTKIGNRALVQEYGLWLANRSPKLGVQVFAEDRGKIRFEPTTAIELLRQEAPGAVRYYLEHLVFAKGHSAHVGELITYYLDVVIGDLQSPASRERVLGAYDAYRALQAPKPTYRHFLAENAADDDEAWQSRLRLLQLLGGAHGYDGAAIRERLSSLEEDLLVPESIILSGRERKHEDALRLLVHKLGDYDTAVAYCLRGGASIYAPASGRAHAAFRPDEQRRLFLVVLGEFLAIDDVSDRVQQTGALLERFGGWFEVDDVLRLVPDSWSADIFGGFLVGALRRLVAEKHESLLARALSGAQNLRVSYDLVVKVDGKGPKFEMPE